MKVFGIIAASSLSIISAFTPVSANVATNEFQMEVECKVSGDMLNINLSGKSHSEFKGANLKVIALPSKEVITETKTLPSSGSDGPSTPTDQFGLFVAPYSPNTTAIQVVGDIVSANGTLSVNTTAKCR